MNSGTLLTGASWPLEATGPLNSGTSLTGASWPLEVTGLLNSGTLLLELLSGLLSGVGLSSGLLFPGTVSLSFLCLVYSSNALSMLDFSSKILSIDFSSSYTF